MAMNISNLNFNLNQQLASTIMNQYALLYISCRSLVSSVLAYQTQDPIQTPGQTSKQKYEKIAMKNFFKTVGSTTYG